MKHRLILITSIAILLFMVLGNCIGCTGGGGTAEYTLTITSTAGGTVTTPGEGTYTYNASQVVNLTATPDNGYRFVNWTATAGTFGNAIAASTTFTMPAQNATVTAHFALGVLIANVPDANQPPTTTLNTTIPMNFCAPMAMANVLEYWDDVANHAQAQNVTAGLIPETVAEYLGWFMDTNNMGSPARFNAGSPGTYDVDIAPGTLEYVRWDDPIAPAPPFAVPAGKVGYNWSVLRVCSISYNDTLSLYELETNSGRPIVVSFDYWNPVDKGINYTDPQTGETISVFVWGNVTTSSHSPNPEELWDYGNIGHAVTGVGYILNWDPDGAGPIPAADWVIVHDNWATTPENVAIPWLNWMCLFPVNP
jgi:Divergent InlB B-repeat domain